MSGFQKFILFALLVAAAVKYGGGYLLSEDFEHWADQKKEPWTCQLENAYAGMHMVMNNYDRAYFRYSHTINRCPDTDMAEEAEFEMARCMEQTGRRHDALVAYNEFLKKYPKSQRAHAADRAAEILYGS